MSQIRTNLGFRYLISKKFKLKSNGAKILDIEELPMFLESSSSSFQENAIKKRVLMARDVSMNIIVS